MDENVNSKSVEQEERSIEQDSVEPKTVAKDKEKSDNVTTNGVATDLAIQIHNGIFGYYRNGQIAALETAGYQQDIIQSAIAIADTIL